MRAVLVVDDEDPVRRFLRIALERAGFRVLTAANGVEAWALLSTEEAVGLVLSDVVMPEMDGTALAARVREMAHPPRFVFMSGFVSDRSRLNAALGRSAPFVQKPFDLDALVKLVREELSVAAGTSGTA
jgi:DNA-binding NtrC family response regulator